VTPTRPGALHGGAGADPARRGDRRCATAGCDICQIDDPHLCLFVDPAVRKATGDVDAEIAMAVDLTNAVTAGIGGITRAIHLCRRNKGRAGWIGAGGYEPILPALRRLDVRSVRPRVSPSRWPASWRCSRSCRRTAASGSAASTAGRGGGFGRHHRRPGRARLEFLPPERIELNPDCGFAPGNAADIPLDEAYAKLCNEAAAARRLRERFSAGSRTGRSAPA
jgi:5-methyltetrahydropteroyltriglutamate--homocysteine methyltransferase